MNNDLPDGLVAGRFVGRCECGAVEYAIESDRLHVYVCHCRNCQVRSGSAFAEHAIVDMALFEIGGPVATYRRRAAEIRLDEFFCGKCFTRIYNTNDVMVGKAFVRAGTLVNSAMPVPVAHIWTDRKRPWIRLPEGVASFARSPTPEEFGEAIRIAEAGATDGASCCDDRSSPDS